MDEFVAGSDFVIFMPSVLSCVP